MKVKTFFSVLLLLSALFAEQWNGQWQAIGRLNIPRYRRAEAILLNDERILIPGGWSALPSNFLEPLKSCEIFNPKTGESIFTDSLPVPLTDFKLVKISDNEYLTVGGLALDSTIRSYPYPTKRCFIYSEQTHTWRETGQMNWSHLMHQVIAFTDIDGKTKIIAIAGLSDNDTRNRCEIYDPETETWEPTASPNEWAYVSFTATYFPDYQKILIATMENSSACEIFDIPTKTWKITTPLLRLHFPSSIRISPEKALIFSGDIYSAMNFESWIFDITTEEWTFAGSLFVSGGSQPAVKLANQKVLTVAGLDRSPSNPFNSKVCQIYDILIGKWQKGPEMNNPRNEAKLIKLKDDRVVVIHGDWDLNCNPRGLVEMYSWNRKPVLLNADFPCKAFKDSLEEIKIRVNDEDEDSVSVRFSWGDNDTTNWLDFQKSGWFSAFHSWEREGTYQIKVQIKDQWAPKVHNSVTDWQEIGSVQIRDLALNQAPIIISANFPEKSFANTPISGEIQAEDPENDSIYIRISWGNGDTTQWQNSKQHFSYTYPDSGTFQIKAQLKDQYLATTDWQEIGEISIRNLSYNQAPVVLKPELITQINDSITIKIQAEDPENDSIYIRISWGNGDTTNWFIYNSSEYEYKYKEAGTYEVKAQAKDVYQAVSNWSEPLVITLVGINKKQEELKEFSLSQNYPNPFNSQTTIEYNLPEKSKEVVLEVYDISGKRIKRFVFQNQQGKYTYSFNFSSLPSGIYFYRLSYTTNSSKHFSSSIKKMILVK